MSASPIVARTPDRPIRVLGGEVDVAVLPLGHLLQLLPVSVRLKQKFLSWLTEQQAPGHVVELERVDGMVVHRHRVTKASVKHPLV